MTVKITDFQKDLKSVPAVEDEETRLMYQIIDERRIMAKFDEILARLETHDELVGLVKEFLESGGEYEFGTDLLNRATAILERELSRKKP